jgi:hypothetical protein
MSQDQDEGMGRYDRDRTLPTVAQSAKVILSRALLSGRNRLLFGEIKRFDRDRL